MKLKQHEKLSDILTVVCTKCNLEAIDSYDVVDTLSMEIEYDGLLLSFEGTIECQHCQHEMEVTLQYNPVYLDVE